MAESKYKTVLLAALPWLGDHENSPTMIAWKHALFFAKNPLPLETEREKPHPNFILFFRREAKWRTRAFTNADSLLF
jgi:hypothetical protein